LEKFENGDFGYCPRYYCRGTPLLPCATADEPGIDTIRMYCANCRDLYQPPSSRFNNLDGAFFGTTFAHLFIQQFPDVAKVSREGFRVYEAKIFGFRVNERATIGSRMRWLRTRFDDRGRNITVVAQPLVSGMEGLVSGSMRSTNATASARMTTGNGDATTTTTVLATSATTTANTTRNQATSPVADHLTQPLPVAGQDNTMTNSHVTVGIDTVTSALQNPPVTSVGID